MVYCCIHVPILRFVGDNLRCTWCICGKVNGGNSVIY